MAESKEKMIPVTFIENPNDDDVDIISDAIGEKLKELGIEEDPDDKKQDRRR